MDINSEQNNYADQRTLDDYHRRLTHLLERMERLEASLESIPLVNRANNMYSEEEDILDEEEEEEDTPDEQLSKEDKDVETDINEIIEKEQENKCQETENSTNN